MSVVEVARQAGHAPTMTLATYARLIADLDGNERLSAEAAGPGRAGGRSVRVTRTRGPPIRKTPVFSGWAIQDSNLGPLPYQRSALTD